MKEIGIFSNPKINNGRPMPLYEASGNIDTPEGWNRLVLKHATPRFIAEYGRNPMNDEEVFAYNQKRRETIIKAYKQEMEAVGA